SSVASSAAALVGEPVSKTTYKTSQQGISEKAIFLISTCFYITISEFLPFWRLFHHLRLVQFAMS
ncbi:hypothetical protein OCK02_02930, partial [Rhizobium sp. TRM96647]|uniref:hypothetical protein n=1 Tax=Rhizobium sp. TRM96647 TaxID=2979861 RepID=UPI0021E93474